MIDNRQVNEVVGSFELWDGRLAREVIVSYDGGKSTRREIEAVVNDKFTPQYVELDADKEGTDEIPVPVLEELVVGLETKVAKHDFRGSADEYQGYARATDEAIEAIEQVIEYIGKGKG